VNKRPLILISGGTQEKGSEFGDLSLSLSECYSEAIKIAGGIPVVLPCLDDETVVAQAIARVDGILLTGGDDIGPDLYEPDMSAAIRRTIVTAHPLRDITELCMIREIFQQRKPLLAICRGQQLLNVAFGGNLIADLPLQMKSCLNHKRFDRKSDPVHDIQIVPDSLLAKISGDVKLAVNSSHHQSVGRVAGPLRVVGRASDKVIEALELKPEAANMLPFMIAVQYHPERLFDRYPPHLELFRQFVQASASQGKQSKT
jgi:putative glutamine amidotransferase